MLLLHDVKSLRFVECFLHIEEYCNNVLANDETVLNCVLQINQLISSRMTYPVPTVVWGQKAVFFKTPGELAVYHPLQ